jgi:hypothetical protein
VAFLLGNYPQGAEAQVGFLKDQVGWQQNPLVLEDEVHKFFAQKPCML